jgi:heptosyltransferase-1
MGDIVHALPAVATLKRSMPSARIAWVIDPKWVPLLAGNPYVDEVIPFNRREWGSVRALWSRLRRERFDLALDLQGLIKSAVIAAASGARQRIGYAHGQARESAASWFYSHPLRTHSAHVVDRNLELAAAAGAGQFAREFPLPQGNPEGELPPGRFVLACPLAGWASKQWPLEYYSEIASQLNEDGTTLVLNGAPGARATLDQVPGAWIHISGIEGLIDATRRAAAVVGVDSGPLHLAAAIGQPGVAIFGPTDPARNGPYGATFTVLRDLTAVTTYKRDSAISASMRAVRPAAVIEALRVRMVFHNERTRA